MVDNSHRQLAIESLKSMPLSELEIVEILLLLLDDAHIRALVNTNLHHKKLTNPQEANSH